jgi:hypothetical protein
MPYEIKGFTKFKGHEGEPCAQGNLYLGKLKIATWSDDSNGGPFILDFINDKEAKAFTAFAKIYLSTRTDYDNKPFDLTGEAWHLQEQAAQTMSHEFEQRQSAVRACKKGMSFRVFEDGSKGVYTTNLAYTPANVAEVRAKYGANLLEIFNETLGLPLQDEEEARKAELLAHYLKTCKKYFLFTLTLPDGTLETRKILAPYSPELAKRIRAKYPNLAEVINERFL